MFVPSELEGFPDTPGINTPFAERFEKIVQQQPDSLAVVSCHQPPNLYGFQSIPLQTEEYRANPYLRWSYATLNSGVDRLVAGLVRRWMKPHIPLFVFCGNQVEYLISMIAAYRLELIFVPLSPEALRQIDDTKVMLGTVVEQLSAKEAVIVANSPDDCATAAGLLPETQTLCAYYGSNDSAAQHNSVPFGYLMNGTRDDILDTPTQHNDRQCNPRSEMIVMHTSGTTVVPKGCLVMANEYCGRVEMGTGLGSLHAGDRIAVTVPIHHMYGFLCITIPLLRGTAVVFPTATRFCPDSFVRATCAERCTVLPIVLSMIHSLLAVLEDNKGVQLEARHIILAGMPASSDLIQRLQAQLGKIDVENLYGMTEGVAASAGPTSDPAQHVCHGHVAIGKPIPGTRISIRDSETESMVSKGSMGGLYFSGPTVIKSYLGNPESGCFHEEKGRTWFKTGDAAFIGDNDMVYVVGRYKDLIVRGGENISPARIEGLLAAHPNFQSLNGSIVSVADAIAGEAPLLVTKKECEQDTIKLVKEVIRDRLGPAYVPVGVLSLQVLGMREYPLTASGKIHKRRLAELVKQYRKSQEDATPILSPSAERTELAVRHIWAKTLGVDLDQLDTGAPVAQLADSMLVISARQRIKKHTGRSVPMSEWLAATTIADQIAMLSANKARCHSCHDREAAVQDRQGPLGALDMIHLAGEDLGFDSVKDATETLVRKDNLEWKDVRDIFPCTDFVDLLSYSRVVDSWNIRISVVTQNETVANARKALEATLRNHTTMISYILHANGLGLHVVMRQVPSILDRCITDYGVLDTLDELTHLTMNTPDKSKVNVPGLLFHALICYVTETESAAIVLNMSHAILDATSIRLFIEDLDQALSGRILAPHVDYKLWADSYHTLRKSPVAESAIRYHVQRLHDLPQHYHVLWPKPAEKLVINEERAKHNGHTITFPAPALIGLQQRYPTLTPPTVLKAALAVVSIAHTKHSHALFCSLEGARAGFPFVPKSYVGDFLRSAEAADVAGPTFNVAINLVDLPPDETALRFLQRIQADQRGVTKHVSVPWQQVLDRLQLPREVLPSLANSLLFNWLPGLAAEVLGESPFEKLRVMMTHIRTKVGMLASAGCGGVDGSKVVINLQGSIANTSTVEIEKIAQEWKKATLWLADESSWDLPVTVLADLLRDEMGVI